MLHCSNTYINYDGLFSLKHIKCQKHTTGYPDISQYEKRFITMGRVEMNTFLCRRHCSNGYHRTEHPFSHPHGTNFAVAS